MTSCNNLFHCFVAASGAFFPFGNTSKSFLFIATIFTTVLINWHNQPMDRIFYIILAKFIAFALFLPSVVFCTAVIGFLTGFSWGISAIAGLFLAMGMEYLEKDKHPTKINRVLFLPFGYKSNCKHYR